jgi:carbonic anhydrase
VGVFAVPVALGLASCGSTGTTSSDTSSESGGDVWSYSGSTGPEYWGSLEPEFAECSTGSKQSPIDVVAPLTTDTRDLGIMWGTTTGEWTNTGHDLQFDVPKSSSDHITVGSNKFSLLQLHVHAPSEHEIDGQRAAMEVHFVHATDKNELAVVGVLVKEGAENGAYSALTDSLPQQLGDAVTVPALDLPSLLPPEQGTYQYAGSLTVPPCSEGVSWFVMQEPVEMSSSQITAMTDLYSDNSRPVQPLNDRPVAKTSS